jgi:hypothetical protein
MAKFRNVYRKDGIDLFETEITMRKGMAIVHNMIIYSDVVNLALLVNSEVAEYNWADATVRGLIPFESWMEEYFEETNKVFRAMSVVDYANQLPSAKIVTEANGNLFWNLGNWVFSNETTFQHYREVLQGKHTAFVQHHSRGCQIETIDFDKEHPFEEIEMAVSGIQIISGGKRIGLLEQHPTTERLLVSDFYGDISHLVNTAMCVPINEHLFYSLSTIEPEQVDPEKMSPLARRVFDYDILSKLSKYTQLECPTLEKAIEGEPICVKVDDATSVSHSLERFGYRRESRLSLRGDYHLEGDKLRVRLLRTTFGHSMISTCNDGVVLLTKVYTDHSRKGGYIEDMVEVIMEASYKLGLNVRDTIIASNGGDLRIYQLGQDPHLISHSKSGIHLTYRGDANYGITSAFAISKRGSK